MSNAPSDATVEEQNGVDPTAAAPHRGIALLVGALTFGFYSRTLAPGLLAGDAGEFQVAAWKWGLAHATGYPLYLIVGGVWQRLLSLVGIAPATALNALSALFGAVAVAMLYLLLVRWLRAVDWFVDDPESNQRFVQVVAIFGALMLAANPTFWSQSLIAEVYSLHLLLMVLIFWLLPIGQNRGHKNRETTKNRNITRRFLLLAFVAGLALTHHAMTLLLLPCVGLALMLFFWKMPDQGDSEGHSYAKNRFSMVTWIGAVIAFLLPLLLYLYIPLRSGPDASPWYHQPYGSGTLSLYQNDWPSFVNFVSGRSISVGFRGVDDALSQLGFAWDLWVLHLSWGGIILAGIGLFALWRSAFGPDRGNGGVARTILLLTVTYAVLQQIFNLFYNIGDIHVYYIPLYMIGALWAAFGAAAIVRGWLGSRGAELAAESDAELESGVNQRASVGLRLGFAMLLLLLPGFLGRSFYPQVDQSENVGTRVRWEEILAAGPPDDAVLISNDRNEIVPLFYLQHVEGRLLDATGLFPLIMPGGRFDNVGSTIETALNAASFADQDRPLYLIKPMPGVESRFDVAARTPPLFEVIGGWDDTSPQHVVEAQFGPLQLLGYDVAQLGEQQEVVLHWRVREPLDHNYTTTVQLFDAAGQRVAQDDRPPGGVFYGTAMWKVGERLRDRHPVDGAAGAETMLVGMYHGPNLERLAEPLEVDLAKSAFDK